MKRLICLILIVMMACSAIWCGNSIFSFGGMPVRYYGNDIYGLSMGDTGLADNFRYNAGFGNPLCTTLPTAPCWQQAWCLALPNTPPKVVKLCG